MNDHSKSGPRPPNRNSNSSRGERTGPPSDRDKNRGPGKFAGKPGGDRKFGGDRTKGERPARDFNGKKPGGRESAGRGPVADDSATFIFPDEPKGVAVRRAAVDILDLVRDGASLDEALSQCRSYYALSHGIGADGNQDENKQMGRADRGFARAMATTVLRRRGTIDHLIGPYIDRPLPAKAARIMDILRVSAAQTLFLDTPAHAAVSLATALAKERQETGGYAGLVNAVARKLSNATPEKLGSLPVRLDTPGWLWRGWERNFGAALARKIAVAHLAAAPLDITVKTKVDRDHWAQLLGAEPAAFNQNTNSLRLAQSPSDITALPGFRDGAWWVQDFSASLAVTLLGDISGKSVIDLCAAPGGKTLQLAAAGANVIAVDRSYPRLERVVENLSRTRLNARTVTADALDYRPDQLVDIVLLDAPCTATGTIRRHPDIPWAKSEDEVASMAKVQERMIDQALTMLKPGGTLLYCTCSLQAEEGETQIETALSRHSILSRKPFLPSENNAFSGDLQGAINRHGDIRLLPFMAGEHGGIDGFFISRLIRR